jgi:hypothetical protein
MSSSEGFCYWEQHSYQIRVNYPFFGRDKADGRRQIAEERKNFRQKEGYQGGFGMNPLLLFPDKNHDFRRGKAFLPQT